MRSDQDDADPARLPRKKKNSKKEICATTAAGSHRALRSGDLALRDWKRSEVAGEHEARKRHEERQRKGQVQTAAGLLRTRASLATN